jgi:SAM-dependent methyltransferase
MSRRTAPGAPRRLDARTRQILTDAVVHRTRVHLSEQLPPEEYEPVAEVLSALGGLWVPGVAATVFPDGEDPAALIAQTLTAGTMPLHPRAAEGWVRTPDEVADELCEYPHSDLRWLPPGSRVLEPSAGIGSLVAAILRTNPHVTVDAVEPNARRAAVCATLGDSVTMHVGGFEDYATTAMRNRIAFDAVVMNPPFAVPRDRAVWMEHLRLAWHLLRPGGRLVAVVPNGLSYRSDAAHRDIRAFIEHHGSHEPLPDGTFLPSGTGFATRVVRLTRPIRSGGPDFLLAPRLVGVPVRVPEPALTGAAATGMPVQVWYDGWRGRDRILRYHGRCIVCGWILWGFDDGENDPRGVLGDFTVGFSLDPEAYGQAGPPVGLCCGCGNDGDRYHAGLKLAEQHWTASPASAAA